MKVNGRIIYTRPYGCAKENVNVKLHLMNYVNKKNYQLKECCQIKITYNIVLTKKKKLKIKNSSIVDNALLIPSEHHS